MVDLLTFVKALGHEIGLSLCEDDKIELAKEFMQLAKEKGVNFYMPVDVVITEEFSETATTKIVGIDSIPSNWEGVDISKTREIYADVIKNSKLVVWNDQWVYSK